MPFTSMLLPYLLPNVIEGVDPKLRDLAMTANQNLLRLVVDCPVDRLHWLPEQSNLTCLEMDAFDLKPALGELVQLLQRVVFVQSSAHSRSW